MYTYIHISILKDHDICQNRYIIDQVDIYLQEQ